MNDRNGDQVENNEETMKEEKAKSLIKKRKRTTKLKKTFVF
jgi:hypothetical protein